MSAKETYPRLESPNPGFLKRDVIRYAKSNSLYTEALGKFSDAQLLGLEMAQVHVLPHIRKKNLKKRKTPNKGGWRRSSIGLEFLFLRDAGSQKIGPNIGKNTKPK